MARLKFGAFLAPHHPLGEHPMLQFRRDLDLVEQLDALGYDEFWCGEHHSSGWEMIASPERNFVVLWEGKLRAGDLQGNRCGGDRLRGKAAMLPMDGCRTSAMGRRPVVKA